MAESYLVPYRHSGIAAASAFFDVTRERAWTITRSRSAGEI